MLSEELYQGHPILVLLLKITRHSQGNNKPGYRVNCRALSVEHFVAYPAPGLNIWD